MAVQSLQSILAGIGVQGLAEYIKHRLIWNHVNKAIHSINTEKTSIPSLPAGANIISGGGSKSALPAPQPIPKGIYNDAVTALEALGLSGTQAKVALSNLEEELNRVGKRLNTLDDVLTSVAQKLPRAGLVPVPGTVTTGGTAAVAAATGAAIGPSAAGSIVQAMSAPLSSQITNTPTTIAPASIRQIVNYISPLLAKKTAPDYGSEGHALLVALAKSAKSSGVSLGLGGGKFGEGIERVDTERLLSKLNQAMDKIVLAAINGSTTIENALREIAKKLGHTNAAISTPVTQTGMQVGAPIPFTSGGGTGGAGPSIPFTSGYQPPPSGAGGSSDSPSAGGGGGRSRSGLAIGGLAAVGAAIGGVGLAAMVTHKVLAATAGTFNTVSTAAQGMGMLKDVFGSVADLVKLFNPAIFTKLQLAIGDTMAAFGEILLPIIAALIPIVKLLGNTIATMKPVFDPIIASVTQMMAVLAELVQPLAVVLTPLLGIVGYLLKEIVVPLLRTVVNTLMWVAQGLKDFINFVIDVMNAAIDKMNWALNKIKENVFWEMKVGEIPKIPKVNFDQFKPQDVTGKMIRGTERMSAMDYGAKIREAAFGQTFNWQQQMVAKQQDQINEQKMTNAILEKRLADLLSILDEAVHRQGILRKQFTDADDLGNVREKNKIIDYLNANSNSIRDLNAEIKRIRDQLRSGGVK